MGQYAGDPAQWVENIYQFDESDVVQGGTDGIDNLPLKNLADRTAFLKEQAGIFSRLAGFTPLAASGNITPAQSGYFILADCGAAAITLALEIAANFKDHTIIAIKAKGTGVANITGGFVGIPGALSLYDNETVFLKAEHNGGGNGVWHIINHTGNLFSVGEEIKARKVLPGTLPMSGQLVERSKYPRLWAFVQSLTMGQEVVDEQTYFSNPMLYTGCFTNGDTVSNFRIPDERGMFDRMADLQRGVDFDRAHPYPGGFQDMNLQSHVHNFAKVQTQGSGTTSGYVNGLGVSTAQKNTDATGGIETRPKNISKINLIKY